MFRRGLLIVSMVLMMTPVVHAQKNAPQAVADNVSMSETGEVSLDFREADIRNVLQILSFKSGMNIVASPEVQGVVTIQLNSVPWKQALDVILQTYGYAYEKKGNIIVVTTVENLKKRREDAMLLAEQEPLETRTFVLNFGKASEVIASVEKMRSDRGSINFDERTNTIIATDTASKLDLMEGVVDKLDATTPQVLIEAKIVETGLNDTENMGIDWITQASVNGAERPTTFPFTSHSDNKYLKDNDFPGTQTTLGNANTEFTYGTLDFSQFQAVLEMLAQRTNTNILSNPRIVTLDNIPASIQVGVDRPIPNYAYNEEQATLQVNGYTWRTIGISFEVTPHVNNAGYVTLDIVPEVSELAGETPFDNINLPLISKEVANTRVMVKDADTLVIAGLLTDKTTDVRKKIPFLGDIPIVGLAFTKNEKTVIKTDLLIFITPHIITPDVGA
ncbi:MAG: type IV pilus secretin PilQ [Candidatus Omnitrophica bacterium]|nr:type IV pilus secretin PilQ [Candidatus Omnitrophota bacterium]